MRKTKGYIFIRGKNYYVSYHINKQRFERALRDENGNSITDKKKAEIAKEKLLAPYLIRNKETLRQQAVNALKGEHEALQEAEKVAENILNPALTFNKAWNVYNLNQKRPQSGERTLKDYASYWNKFYNWIKNNKPELIYLREVTENIASEYALFLKQSKVSAGTFNKHRDFLKIFFHYLKEPAKIKKNPFEEIKRLNNKPDSRRPLTIEEIKTIIRNAPTNDMQILLALGIFTGLRLGDCCTLQWHEINLDTAKIIRIPNKTARKKEHVIIGIPNLLLNKLIEFPKSEQKGYLLPMYAEKYNNLNTRPSIVRAIQCHIKNCGIEIYKPGTGPGTNKRAIVEVGMHSLRHSFVSLQARSGVSQSILAKQAGHSVKMSEHYTHLSDETIKNNANLLESALGFSETKTIEPIPEISVLRNQIKKALDYINTIAIPRDIKQNLLGIFTLEK